MTALPAPAPESLFENVLSTAHPGLERQREEFRSFTASLAPEGTEDSAS